MKNNIKYSNSEYLNGILNHNEKVLNGIYKNYFRQILFFVCSNSGTKADAQDVFQETIIVIYRNVSEKKKVILSTKFEYYLFAISKKIWLKELQSRQNQTNNNDSLVDFEATEDSIVEDHILFHKRQELLSEKLKELSDDCKKVLTMFIKGFSPEQIKRKMGYNTVQHAKNRKYRCKEALLTMIRKDARFKTLGYDKQ